MSPTVFDFVEPSVKHFMRSLVPDVLSRPRDTRTQQLDPSSHLMPDDHPIN